MTELPPPKRYDPKDDVHRTGRCQAGLGCSCGLAPPVPALKKPDVYSVNTHAESIMGRRSIGVPIDLPLELGYQCPVCKVYSEGLDWSEYNGFLWCETCNYDYPSALCVPLEGEPYSSSKWVNFGRDAAVKIFLASVDSCVQHKIPEPPDDDVDQLLTSIWLYVDWRYVTKNLTTAQKERWVSALSNTGAIENVEDWRWWN